MAPPPKPGYPPYQGPQPTYPPGQPGAPPPPAGYKPMGPPPVAGAPPPPPPAGYKPMAPPPMAGAPPQQPPAGYKPMAPPQQPPAGYKPMAPPPGGAPPPAGFKPGAPPAGIPPKPGLPPPPPAAMVVAKPPPPKKIEPVKKPKKKKKFLDTIPKKVSVIIMVIGLVIASLGFAYPSLYWSQQNAYSSANLKANQQNTGTLILYTTWNPGDILKVHDTVVSIQPMVNNIFINGVTYSQILPLNLNQPPTSINDHILVKLNNDQYLMIPGLQSPNIHVGDAILAQGQVRTIIGTNSQSKVVQRSIISVESADIEQNNMDTVFLGVGIFGVVILFVGLTVWMFFVFRPEDSEPKFQNIHEVRKQEFMDSLTTQQTKKEYACPVCGLNMTYKPEFGKWYCEICNKLY